MERIGALKQAEITVIHKPLKNIGASNPKLSFVVKAVSILI